MMTEATEAQYRAVDATTHSQLLRAGSLPRLMEKLAERSFEQGQDDQRLFYQGGIPPSERYYHRDLRIERRVKEQEGYQWVKREDASEAKIEPTGLIDKLVDFAALLTTGNSKSRRIKAESGEEVWVREPKKEWSEWRSVT